MHGIMDGKAMEVASPTKSDRDRLMVVMVFLLERKQYQSLAGRICLSRYALSITTSELEVFRRNFSSKDFDRNQAGML